MVHIYIYTYIANNGEVLVEYEPYILRSHQTWFVGKSTKSMDYTDLDVMGMTGIPSG